MVKFKIVVLRLKQEKSYQNIYKPLTKNEFVINNTQILPAMLHNVPISEDEEDLVMMLIHYLQIFLSKTQ